MLAQALKHEQIHVGTHTLTHTHCSLRVHEARLPEVLASLRRVDVVVVGVGAAASGGCPTQSSRVQARVFACWLWRRGGGVGRISALLYSARDTRIAHVSSL